MANWTCPFCQHAQAMTNSRTATDRVHLDVYEALEGDVGIEAVSFVCSNRACRRLSLTVKLIPYSQTGNYYQPNCRANAIRQWKLLPQSSAKPQPDCVPEPLRNDYYEACAIRDLSPKASATLSRRCLQGMIRDFCNISKRTLDAEIKALRVAVEENSAPRGVTEESIDAIDAVRTVGNIGAHMEKDISLIVDVDPGEAQILIELVESLFDEWYVARDRRNQKFAAVRAVADSKREIIETHRADSTVESPPEPEVEK